MDERIKELADRILESNSALAFTGAGLSTASGIPDFRSEDGLWSRYDPHTFSIQSLRSNPESFWKTYRELHEEIASGEQYTPNAAHKALSELTENRQLEAIITQNVDGLQQEAGTSSEKLLKLHGDAQRLECMDCNWEIEIDQDSPLFMQDELPPECRECGGLLKPSTVLFGERLPQDTLRKAQNLSRKSEVFIVAGSSLTVHPASSLPSQALDNQASVAIINLQPTSLDSRADFVFQADVTDVLPRLANQVIQSSS
jgi:NAD-dependent deacetylase